jgi:predicted dienelactone hydrolase
VSFLADELVRLSNQDESPFEGWVDASKGFGVTGHSFGAFTSLAVASMDDRFVAVLPMAFGGPVSDTYSAATLLLLATQDKTIGLAGNEGVRETFGQLSEPRFIGEIVDAGHYSFSFACQTGLGIGDGDGCKTGTRLEDGSPVTFVSDLRVWRSSTAPLRCSAATSTASPSTTKFSRPTSIRRSLLYTADPDVTELTAPARRAEHAPASRRWLRHRHRRG